MSSEQKAFFHSFDAAVWAKAFIERAKSDPSIAIDEGTMIAWFANALMRGYDEYRWRQEKTGPTENSLQLAAKAWCEPDTSGIEMDSRLATAFALIIDKDRAPLLARIAELEAQAAENEENDLARDEKLRVLSASHEIGCGCSYDTPDDVCCHHSPQLTKAMARVSELEAKLENSNEALRRLRNWGGITGAGWSSTISFPVVNWIDSGMKGALPELPDWVRSQIHRAPGADVEG